jgi:GntR family transcriptional regulator, arabinose operon transcriptional repressor
MDNEPKKRAKYIEIIENLRSDITSGRFQPGVRLPTESELIRRFAASRMTVVKAVQLLQREGLLIRRRGSGTFVAELSKAKGMVFGLLIPGLGKSEIFELICRGIANSPAAANHSLSWGHTPARTSDEGELAEQLARNFIEQRVSGVFFTPGYALSSSDTNARALRAFDEANIPVVLMDGYSIKYPEHRNYDLVGLDNRRAGYIMTDHLIRQGGTRIAFFAAGTAAETVEDRISGYLAAQFGHGLTISRERIIRGDPEDQAFVEKVLRTQKIDSIVCSNDYLAAKLMHTLIGLGVRIPADIRLAGVDDIKYARLLPVPLTTFRQPCDEIGAVCMSTMLERIQNRQLPARSIQLHGKLIVRQSCGSAPEPN